jgi:hypothetical protein
MREAAGTSRFRTGQVKCLKITAHNAGVDSSVSGRAPHVGDWRRIKLGGWELEGTWNDFLEGQAYLPQLLGLRFIIGGVHTHSLCTDLFIRRPANHHRVGTGNIGGDSDSVASTGGAIAGALYPNIVDEQWVDGRQGNQRPRSSSI